MVAAVILALWDLPIGFLKALVFANKKPQGIMTP
jgi:hypothetical protein